jgi:hypothetical protein
VFTGDLLPSSRFAYSLGPFALWTAFPSSLVGRYSHDYYGSSATPRRQQRTVRLPRTPQGSAGTAWTLPTFTHQPVGRVGAQLYPGDIAAHYRNTPHGLARPSDKSGQDGPEQQPGPSIPTAHSRQFPGCCPVSGLQALVRLLRLSALLPHPARWRRTVARSSGAACRPPPHLRHQAAPQLLPTVTAAGGGLLSHPPGCMAPRGAVLPRTTRGSAGASHGTQTSRE